VPRQKRRKLPLILDYDDTLVYWRNGPEGEWVPGAQAFLKWCTRQGWSIIVASARANFSQGEEEIRRMLDRAGFSKIEIAQKPLGFAYVDDKAVPASGDWAEIRVKVRRLAKA
jgi:predicted HAD superfamily phosphohydrolase YqeG